MNADQAHQASVMSRCSTDAVCCPPGGTPIDPEPTAPAHFPRMLRGKNSGRATIGDFTGTWVRLFLPRCTGEVADARRARSEGVGL